MRPPEGRHERFVEEYLVDLNATQAAIRAGYSPGAASRTGNRLLKIPAIAAAIAQAQRERSARTGITTDRVLTELARLGFSDIRDIVRWRALVAEGEDGGEGGDGDGAAGDGRPAAGNEVRLIDADAIGDDVAAAIAEIVQTDRGGLKVKLHDKRAALVAIGRHLGMFVERREITGRNGGPIEHAVERLGERP